VFLGQRLQIHIQVEGLDAFPEPNVNVLVTSSANQRIFRLSSRMVPLHSAHPRCRDEAIVIDIPTLPLTPGDYSLTIAIHDLKNAAVVLDEVERAAEFSVIPGDIHGNGYQYNASRDGQVMVPFDWEIRPTRSDRAGVTGPDPIDALPNAT
jgi:hypothetical protein